MVQVSQALADAIAAGKPQRVLLEFFNDQGELVRTFSNEDVSVSRGVTLRETFNGETDLSIGQCPSAEISFTLLNDVNQITEFRFGKFKAWLGARIDSGTPTGKTAQFTERGGTATYEFAPLGVFIADRPDVVRKQMIEIRANDQMTLLDKEWSSSGISVTWSGLTAGNLLTAICTAMGITCATSTFLNSGASLTKKPSGIDNMTVREVLGWIAEAAASVARFNRNGELELVWFTPVAKAFDEHGYTEFTPAWYQVNQIDKLAVRNAAQTSEIVVGTGTTSTYVITNNPFLRS